MTIEAVVPKSSTKADQKRLSCWWAICLVAYIGLIVALPYVFLFRLPDIVDPFANTEEFDGQEARFDLLILTAPGPRILGSTANEVTAINFISSKIDEIASLSKGHYKIEKDIQVSSGAYDRYCVLNAYEAVQNVIVKLTPLHSNHTNALLINSHFDSVVGSPGAGDDGSMVVVMLGILSALTKSHKVVEHPIIFLFNGNEEKGLEGAHAFMTQHQWAQHAKIYINLEGMGVGGKELLFKTGPGNLWLLNYYAKSAKHPFASVLGEELYDNNMLPADTDSSIFRGFGNLVGLDFAFIKNGYAYHTRLDTFSGVDQGTLQNTGDNILALTRALADAKELDEDQDFRTTGKAIYFDVFGLFVVSYSQEVGTYINYSVCVIALIAIIVSILLINHSTKISFYEVIVQFTLSFGVYIGSLLIAGGIVSLIAFLVDVIGYSMSWYSHLWLLYGLYFCPFIFIVGIFLAMFLEWQRFCVLPLNAGITLFLHCHCIILMVSTIGMTLFRIRATFALTNVIIFYILPLLFNLASGLYKKPHIWIIPMIIGQSIPIAFNASLMGTIFTVFIPLAGRNPNNQEITIAFVGIGFSLLVFGFMIPIFSIFKRAKSIISSSLIIFLITSALIFTSFYFQYTKDTPQRHGVFHMARNAYSFAGEKLHEDNIYLMSIMDRHSEETLKDVALQYSSGLYSGEQDVAALRFYFDYRWIQAPPLQIPSPARLKLLSKTEVGPDSAYRFDFQLSGTLYYRIVIETRQSLIDDWSFGNTTKDPWDSPRNRLETIIQFGKTVAPYNFSVVLRVYDLLKAALSVSVQARYLDEDHIYSYDLDSFLRSFPEWTAVTGTVASYDVYEF